MIRSMLRGLLIALAVPVLAAMPASAASYYFEDFGSQPVDLHFVNFEGGVSTPGLACGTDACASFESDGQTNSVKVTVNPSQNPGFYTNTDITQVDLGAPSNNAGPYTPSYGHPVVMEARIKWSSNYDLLGLGDAQGTSGIVLWNPALDGPYGSPSGEYDQIGFVWASKDVLAGLISGFTATSFINQVPLGIARPILPVNINDWVDVKMVWSESLLGIQTVTYYANNQLLGVHVLPVPLEGLGLEIWNDNSEPYLCLEGVSEGLPICFNDVNPNQPQSFYVDYVRIVQP